MGSSIKVGGKRISAVKSAWHPEGHWMLVWDGYNVPFLRKVVCVLPARLEVPFPVYAMLPNHSGCSSWLHAGEIPEGLDIIGIDGYYDMQEDYKHA